MNSLSMESIFLILSGAILAAGILYWFWSHIQLTQKKVQLLENAVFELRGMQGPPSSSNPSSSSSNPSSSSSNPSDEELVYNDIEDDDVQEQTNDWHVASTPLDAIPIDLQPGGRLEVPAADNDTQFRELFIQEKPKSPAISQIVTEVPAINQESLESMPVKELRRLAEQRGLTGVSELRKKELIAALRNLITPPVTEVEKENEVTLDLTEEAVLLE